MIWRGAEAGGLAEDTKRAASSYLGQVSGGWTMTCLVMTMANAMYGGKASKTHGYAHRRVPNRDVVVVVVLALRAKPCLHTPPYTALLGRAAGAFAAV